MMDSQRKISVKLRGRTFDISPAETHQVLMEAGHKQYQFNRGKAPEYFVLVGDEKLPVKQALKLIMDKKRLGLTILDVTTKDAVNIFRRLGFPIVVERGTKGSKTNIMKYVGTLSYSGNSVEDKKALYDNP